MMDVFKDKKSSDSWKRAFVRKVREIDVVVNWSVSMFVVREKIEFSYFPVVGTKTVCLFEYSQSSKRKAPVSFHLRHIYVML